MLARHMVIHIDATKADSRTRRELFATTREGFKQGAVLSGLEETLKSILLGDTMLFDIEPQLAERMIRMDNVQTADAVKMTVTKLHSY